MIKILCIRKTKRAVAMTCYVSGHKLVCLMVSYEHVIDQKHFLRILQFCSRVAAQDVGGAMGSSVLC